MGSHFLASHILVKKQMGRDLFDTVFKILPLIMLAIADLFFSIASRKIEIRYVAYHVQMK